MKKKINVGILIGLISLIGSCGRPQDPFPIPDDPTIDPDTPTPDPEPEPEPDPEPEPEPTPEKKGCGGSIIATSAIISTLALAGGAIALASKKRKK